MNLTIVKAFALRQAVLNIDCVSVCWVSNIDRMTNSLSIGYWSRLCLLSTTMVSPVPWVSGRSDERFRPQDCCCVLIVSPMILLVLSGSEQRYHSRGKWSRMVYVVCKAVWIHHQVHFRFRPLASILFHFAPNCKTVEYQKSIVYVVTKSSLGFVKYAVTINRLHSGKLWSLLLMVEYAVTIDES